MSITKKVEAALPAAARSRRARWIDRLRPADRDELHAIRRRLHAGELAASAAQVSRAISAALEGAVCPHTIVLWLHERN